MFFERKNFDSTKDCQHFSHNSFEFQEIFILILAVEWKGDQMSGPNFLGLLLCLGGITLHVIRKILVSEKQMANELELQSNCDKDLKTENAKASNLPLLMAKSTSLTNLLNGGFSSEEDDDKNESSSQILFNIVQRRERM